jgi:hypothetical protein
MRSNLDLFLERLPVDLDAASSAAGADRTTVRRATTGGAVTRATVKKPSRRGAARRA